MKDQTMCNDAVSMHTAAGNISNKAHHMHLQAVTCVTEQELCITVSKE